MRSIATPLAALLLLIAGSAAAGELAPGSLEQLAAWFAEHIEPLWVGQVTALQELLVQGDAVQQMMQVTGEEGVTTEDYVTYQKALFLDMVYLQQDAYDKVDASVSLDRQRLAFTRVHALVSRDYAFADKAAVRDAVYFLSHAGADRRGS
mgnify:CR=1 FL=1